MNKIYVSPKAELITLHAEEMLALSMNKIDTSAGESSEEMGGTSALSGERGWDSSLWGSEEE